MTRIAVIGMACRFPRAATPRAFWDNLVAGRDCITRLPREELAGLVRPARLEHPRFVSASGLIDGVFDFDPGMYAMAPAEAVLTDPQHRLFLDVAREALERAGVVGGRGQDIAVYAGVGRSRHEALVRGTLPDPDVDDVLLEIGNEKDYFATRVSYRLGLTGPSAVVQSACSTGLLAVHQAALSLANYECDVALAGAAAIRVPQEYGYVFQHGGIGSASGHCRPFSAHADGSVAGDGVACVVLKRLEDAVADGDRPHAVLLGSAVNNDGAKDGFASVSAAAQVRVMESALRFAELDPAAVDYVETHGSGTALGDATEWTALRRVYRHGPAVGAVKANVGHLREASGLAGLIKAVHAVELGVVPANPYADEPAAFTLGAGGGPRLPGKTQGWTPANAPRRAGVSAFGLGGTNVHLLLEQPPAPPPAAPPVPGPEVLTVTAHSAAALAATARDVAAALRGDAVPAAGAARTLQERRAHHRYRWAVTAESAAALAGELTDARAVPDAPVGEEPRIGFVFSGIGDHYPGMATGLFDYLPGFKERLLDAADQAGAVADRDFRPLLLAGVPRPPAGRIDLRAMLRGRENAGPPQSALDAHVVMFCLQYALAGALAEVGVVPAAVMGHSLGELAAATAGGVLDPQDAFRVVVTRARLVADQPPGGMLAVALPHEQAAELTGPGVWLATVNTPGSCVLAGDSAALLALSGRLGSAGVQARPMGVSRAFHTPMLAGAAAGLTELLGSVRLRPPRLPMVSGLTARWAGPEVALPEHWVRQLTSTVHFGAGVERLSESCSVLVEIGPGQLRSVAGQTRLAARGVAAVPTVRRDYEENTDQFTLARALGRIWQAGVPVDWPALRSGRPVPAAPLPPRAACPATHRATASAAAPGWQPVDATTAVPVAPVDRPAPSGPSASPAETALAGIWQSVLGVERIGARDHFFDLGGDSLMGARLIALLEESVGVHVPSPVVFASAVLSRMARNVQEYLDTEARSR